MPGGSIDQTEGVTGNEKRAPKLVGVPVLIAARLMQGAQPVSRIDAVFERFARFEGDGIAGFDLYRLTGLRVLAGAGTTMTLQKGAETDQGNAVFPVQRIGDFFENGVEDAIGLFFGEVRLFSDGGC